MLGQTRVRLDPDDPANAKAYQRMCELHDALKAGGLTGQAIAQAECEGRPLREQNLSEWRKGGYRDWVAQQQALKVAERLRDDDGDLKGGPALSDTLSLWIVARYAVATRMLAEAEGREPWQLLRELCSDIVELRKGDHSAERLQIERERIELEKERTSKRAQEKLEALLKLPETERRLFEKGLSEEEREKKMRALFGLSERAGRGGISEETLAEIERMAKLL